MHNAAFKNLGLDGFYEARDISPESLAQAVKDLRRETVLGANVSVPHKLAVMPLLDELSEEAKAVGAVNTVVKRHGALLGHNTDAKGYARALEQAAFDLQGKRAVLLGAGGAARAVAYALLRGGSSLQIYNRTPQKAHALATDFARYGEVNVLTDAFKSAIKNCHLLVNTTSVGMEVAGHDPDLSPLPDGLLPAHALVSDIVYKPAKTRLLRDAEAKGLSTQNGLPMLVYQGAESFKLWTGQAPDADVMFRAAQQVLEN